MDSSLFWPNLSTIYLWEGNNPHSVWSHDYFIVQHSRQQLFFFKTIQIIQTEKKTFKGMHADQDQTKHLVLMTEPMGKPYMLGSGVSSHDWEWKGEGIDGLIWEVKLIQFVKWVTAEEPWTVINNNLSQNFPTKHEIQCLVIRMYFFQIPRWRLGVRDCITNLGFPRSVQLSGEAWGPVLTRRCCLPDLDRRSSCAFGIIGGRNEIPEAVIPTAFSQSRFWSPVQTTDQRGCAEGINSTDSECGWPWVSVE